MRGDTRVQQLRRRLLTAFTSSLAPSPPSSRLASPRGAATARPWSSAAPRSWPARPSTSTWSSWSGCSSASGSTLLQKIRGADVDVGNELDDIVATNSAPTEGEQYRPQLVMAVMILFFQQVISINAVLLHTIGMGESASLPSAMVTGVVGVRPTFLSMLAVDRFRRRTLFLVGGVQMLASQMLIGAIMAAMPRDGGGVSKAVASVLILLIAVYVAGFGRLQKGFIHLEKLLDFITFLLAISFYIIAKSGF
ncbi:hypothetical protein ACP70R_049643 [Stipagrostis hirtigluma subsp. patula]